MKMNREWCVATTRQDDDDDDGDGWMMETPSRTDCSYSCSCSCARVKEIQNKRIYTAVNPSSAATLSLSRLSSLLVAFVQGMQADKSFTLPRRQWTMGERRDRRVVPCFQTLEIRHARSNDPPSPLYPSGASTALSPSLCLCAPRNAQMGSSQSRRRSDRRRGGTWDVAWSDSWVNC